MKSKDKIEWLPPHLATEYDRLACQLLGSGGKITEKYEKNEETFFFFSRLDYLAQRIGFRSFLIDRNVFDFVAGNVIEELPPWEPALLREGFCCQFFPGVPFPGEIKSLWGFSRDDRIFLGGSSGGNRFMSSCEVFIPGKTKKEELLKNLQDIPEEEADFTFRFVFTLALLLEAENSPLRETTKKYKAQSSLFGMGFTKTVLRLYLPEEKEKELATVQVKGFLRNQAYGENWSLHRVIYISPFERIQKINKK